MSTIADAVTAARESGNYEALIGAIPYMDWMGIRIERGAEETVCVLPFAEMLIGNPMLPALHGGVTGAFLESAAVVSLMVEQEAVKVPKTINITIEYLRPGGPRDTYATGIITKQGRRVANVRALAWQDDRSHPIAFASAHFLLAE
jgi:uncharacterized protein (TIGR00369 family)